MQRAHRLRTGASSPTEEETEAASTWQEANTEYTWWDSDDDYYMYYMY